MAGSFDIRAITLMRGHSNAGDHRIAKAPLLIVWVPRCRRGQGQQYRQPSSSTSNSPISNKNRSLPNEYGYIQLLFL